MTGVLDYIAWRGDLSFEVAPINELDMFLFAQIVMADFQGIVREDAQGISLAEAAKKYFENHDTSVSNLGALQSNKALPALKAMAGAKRYRDIMLSNHVNCVCNENNEQFSATAFKLSPEVCAVVYRGTDDSLIGWKEDCYLAIYDEVPAQRDALEFLEKVASEFPGKIIVSGHSKGGNLAVYAPAHACKEVQDRIIHIFNYDGPGFSQKFLNDFEGYTAIKNKITTFVSQHSIIGLLMDTAGKVVYTRSNVEGLYAHDGFNWEVELSHFVRVRGLSKFSRSFDEVFSNAMDHMTMDEKKNFVEELFGILFSTGADTVSEFRRLKWKVSLGAFNKITASQATKDFFHSFMVSLASKDE